jgi:hypothetical protein
MKNIITYRPNFLAWDAPALEIDTDRLTWRRGHPSHDGETWLNWAHYSSDGSTVLAYMESAIVSDTVYTWQLVEGPQHHDDYNWPRYLKLRAEYTLVDHTHVPTQEDVTHRLQIVWRLVRAQDGRTLYSSLSADEYHRVVYSEPPADFGARVRDAINAGELPKLAEDHSITEEL